LRTGVKKLKKLILCSLIVLVSGTSAFAINNFYIDAYGAFTTNKDAKIQYGGGGALGYNVTGDFNVIYKMFYTIGVKNPNTNYEYSLNTLSNLVGLEYVFPIGRLGWKSSLMAGISSLTIKAESDNPNPIVQNWDDNSKSGMGIAGYVTTGIVFNATQHVSPFLDLGFHYDYHTENFYYTADEGFSVFGFSVLLGVRVTIGNNRSIDADY